METIEAACVAVHAPPVNAEAQRKRQEAEYLLEQFKKSPHALTDAIALLQHTSQPLVQFHCVATIREVTLKKWGQSASSDGASGNAQDKTIGCDFLMQFLMAKYHALPKYVTSAMLQTIVAILKRGWLERTKDQRLELLQQMGSMMQINSTSLANGGTAGKDGSELGNCLLATKWMFAFMTEFASPSKSSVMFQPVEFHTKSRKALQSHGLDLILGFALELLQNLVQQFTTLHAQLQRQQPQGQQTHDLLSKQHLELLELVFLLCIELLNWNFQDAHGNLIWTLSGSAEKEDETNRVTLQPSSNWRQFLIRPDMIQCAFQTYLFLREMVVQSLSSAPGSSGLTLQNGSVLLHLSRQFLIQLASIKGPIFESAQEQVAFQAEIFKTTSQLVRHSLFELLTQNQQLASRLQDPNVQDLASRELIDCCQLYTRIINNLGLKSIFAQDFSSENSSASANGTDPSSSFGRFVVEELSILSCLLLKSSFDEIQHQIAKSKGSHSDLSFGLEDLWQYEALDVVLDGWNLLIHDQLLDDPLARNPNSPTSLQRLPKLQGVEHLLSEFSKRVVEQYLHFSFAVCEMEVLHESFEQEEDDANVEEQEALDARRREQMACAASLARMNTEACASFLLDSLKQVLQFVQQALQSHQTQANNPNETMPTELAQAYEKLCWLLQFIGEFMANEFHGEKPELPPRIQRLLLHDTASQQGNARAPLMELLQLILHDIVAFEAARVQQNAEASWLSPFVSEQLLNTMTRVGATYLTPSGFEAGLFQGNAHEIMDFLVHQCTLYLVHWPTQPVVMKHLMEFLLILSKAKVHSGNTGADVNVATTSTLWQQLLVANLQAPTYLFDTHAAPSTAYSGDSSISLESLEKAMAHVPAGLRGHLTEALARGSAHQEAFLLQAVLPTLEARIQKANQVVLELSNPSLTPAQSKLKRKQLVNDVLFQEEVQLICELLCGLGKCCDSGHPVAAISLFCLQSSSLVVQWLAMFLGANNQVSSGLLRFFAMLVETQLIYFKAQEATQVMTIIHQVVSQCCLHWKRTSTSNHPGGTSKPSAGNTLVSSEEQEQIVLLLKLLSNLLQKDWIDFAEDEANAASANNLNLIVLVAFEGLEMVMSLFKQDTLRQNDALASNFFELVSFLVQVYADQLNKLAPQALQHLLEALVIGMRHVQKQICVKCVEAMGEIALYHWKSVSLHAQTPSAPAVNDSIGLQRFAQLQWSGFLLQNLFEFVLFEDFAHMEVLDAIALALLPLLLIDQNQWIPLLRQIGEKHHLQVAIGERLMNLVYELMGFIKQLDAGHLPQQQQQLQQHPRVKALPARGAFTAQWRQKTKLFKTRLYEFVANARGFLQVK